MLLAGIARSDGRGISGCMASRAKRKRTNTGAAQRGKPTSAKLIAAAAKEFNTRGFHGTDTNRIARRAGFAPQTFYRHFADKTAIFLAVYERWWKDESAALQSVLRDSRPSPTGAARVVISF